jgi:hypothetical protein
MFISSVTYAVVGFGEAGCPHPKGTRRLPKISLFARIVAAEPPQCARIKVFGGTLSLQTSL